jgi:branched-chain amino acid transport system substrate-binding protein
MDFKAVSSVKPFVAVLGASLVAVSGVSLAADKEMVVKIGHVAPMSGPQAHYGKDNENGARLAIEDLNKKGMVIDGAKVKFELVAEDDAADAKQGNIVAQKLCDLKVAGVIGHLNSGTTIPASRIYNDCGLVQITPAATNPKITQQGYKGMFRVIANDGMLGVALGDYAVKTLKAKKVVVIDDRTGYGQPLADIFTDTVKKAGGNVVDRHYTNDKATDFNAILTAVKAKNPDVVFYGGMDAQAGPMLRQMKQLGIKASFMGGDGICTAELAKLGGDNVGKNVVCGEGGMDLKKMTGGPAFEKRYKEAFKTDIQLYAPFVYDATMVLGTAMQKANSIDPAKYLPELQKTDYKGLVGRVTFDDKGDIKNGAITLRNYVDGKKNALTVMY